MRIFIHCPDVVTGGTELIHQFAHCLMNKNINAYVIYNQENKAYISTPSAFEKYGVKYVTQYVDAKDSVLVLAETQINLMSLCKLGKIIIWWMSVDNYRYYREQFPGNNLDFWELKHRPDIIHLCQSEYSRNFITNEFEISNYIFLKDYINEDILNFSKLYNFSDKIHPFIEFRKISQHNLTIRQKSLNFT